MSKLKGYPLPEGAIDGYPLICVRMMIPDDPQYRRDFIGHQWLLGKWWSWEHGTPGDTRAKQAGEYWRDLLSNHLVLEDCPVDCCEDILAALAVLQTGIVNQDALQVSNQVTQRALESKALRDALEDMYDGSPTSINPAAPTVNFGSSGDRYDALCAALMAFVYQYARAQADSVRAGQVGGLAAIALIAALLIPGLNIFFLVGASIAILAGLGTVGVTTETAISALTDQEALDNVVCCMRDALRFDAVSEANWITALNACSFAGGSNEQIIADFILPTLSSNYLTILNILGEAYTGVIGGASLPECPCEPPPSGCLTGHFQNFQANNGSFTPYFARASWVAAQGWTIGAVPATPVRIAMWGTLLPQVTKAKIVTFGYVDEIRLYRSSSGTIVSLIAATAAATNNGDGTYTYTFATVGTPAGTELLIDCGGGASLAGKYVRSVCYNY